mgnify:FL=1
MDGITIQDRPPYVLPLLSLVDTLVYFSHHVVTPPPRNWIHATQRCRTSILGTLIFEWEAGSRELCHLLAQSEECARQLVAMAVHMGFHGWLVNIECSLAGPKEVEDVISFVDLLRTLLHEVIPG